MGLVGEPNRLIIHALGGRLVDNLSGESPLHRSFEIGEEVALCHVHVRVCETGWAPEDQPTRHEHDGVWAIVSADESPHAAEVELNDVIARCEVENLNLHVYDLTRGHHAEDHVDARQGRVRRDVHLDEVVQGVRVRVDSPIAVRRREGDDRTEVHVVVGRRDVGISVRNHTGVVEQGQVDLIGAIDVRFEDVSAVEKQAHNVLPDPTRQRLGCVGDEWRTSLVQQALNGEVPSRGHIDGDIHLEELVSVVRISVHTEIRVGTIEETVALSPRGGYIEEKGRCHQYCRYPHNEGSSPLPRSIREGHRSHVPSVPSERLRKEAS